MVLVITDDYESSRLWLRGGPLRETGIRTRQVTWHAIVESEMHDNVRVKVKDPNFSSKRNPRVDVFSGDDLRKSDGMWMKKERVIDKDNDLYKETVADPKTGKTIHHNEELLSDHFGHGSGTELPSQLRIAE